MDNLVRWGFNFVRLAIFWEAHEIERETYNQTYFDEIEIIINDLENRGIFTLIDVH